jgi:proline iminopeptidase
MIESANASLFTTIYQRENAETVVILHGGPGVPMDFSSIAGRLNPKYQIITFDQRGTGRSPVKGATYSIDEYLGDLDAISRHYHLDRFHLFGHSWGGLYAQIYAERNPDRLLSMFLRSPSSGTGLIWKETEREVMRFNKRHSSFGGYLKMGLRSLRGALGSDSAYRAMFKQVLANYNKDFDPAFEASDSMVENVRADPINKTRRQIVKSPLLKDAVDYHFPIVIAYGEMDIYGPSRRYVMTRFPKARFVEIEGAGHIAWQHNQEKFDAILKDFYHLSP